MASAIAGNVEVDIVSRRTVRPFSSSTIRQSLHLTIWDLQLISLGYIQKGILLPRPPSASTPTELLISRLATSLAHALDHFFPFAGRLAATHHDTDPPAISLSLDCTDHGVEFIHASATATTASDVLSPTFIPSIVASFFPLRGASNVDGVSIPLLGVQVTVLADAVFLGCSLNHVASDGSSFWNFFNAWSEISRTADTDSDTRISRPPSIPRWFPDSFPPPILLPFASTNDLRASVNIPPGLNECVFHFSPASVAKLKAEANGETVGGISSLQSLLAHVWRCVTRARELAPGDETRYGLAVGHRTRLSPPLPPNYLGNALRTVEPVTVAAGELLSRPLGWAAWKLNRAVASQTDEYIRRWLGTWAEKPSINRVETFRRGDLFTGSSPRFDVFGNDFGWGPPTAVRSGGANKFDGKVTAYPGPETGSIMLEVSLDANALHRLLQDREFMEFVGPSTPVSGEDSPPAAREMGDC